MMETILYLYDNARRLVAEGHPMSILRQDTIFEKVIAIKYDVPNSRLDLFDEYKKKIDEFYENVLKRNA